MSENNQDKKSTKPKRVKTDLERSIIDLKADALLLTSFFIQDPATPILKRFRERPDDDHTIFAYNATTGLYQRISYTHFSQLFQAFLRKNSLTTLWNNGRVKTIYDALISMSEASLISEQTGTPLYDDYICFQDCVLNWKDFTTMPHSPDLFFVSSIALRYYDVADAMAQETPATHFCKFLDEIMPTLEDQNTLIKLGGYLLYQGGNPATRIFSFIGEGANGKSLLLNLYQEMFGGQMSSAISSLSLEEMSNVSGFDRGLLETSRINIVAEQKGSAVDWEEIKKIIDGFAIKINPKFVKPYFIRPRCKLIMASNDIPYIKDRTHAAHRRLYPIKFPSTFVTPDYMQELIESGVDIKEQRYFPMIPMQDMEDRFRSELPAICGMFLRGLVTLHADSWLFPETQLSRDTRTEFAEATDIVRFWIKKYLKIDSWGVEFMTNDEVYNLFCVYYETQVGGDPKNRPTKQTFCKRIIQIMGLKTVFKKIDNKSYRGYLIKYKDPDDQPGI